MPSIIHYQKRVLIFFFEKVVDTLFEGLVWFHTWDLVVSHTEMIPIREHCSKWFDLGFNS
jgi:hypothetical protein